MSNPLKQWGGVRRHSGRPYGGAREVHRILKKSVAFGEIEDAAQIVARLILEGRGGDVLKVWYRNISVFEEYLEAKRQAEKKQMTVADAYKNCRMSQNLTFDFKI